MSRLRTLKPGFFSNEDLAACSFPARLAFAGLWVEADRAGRLKDQPQLLRSHIFPFDPDIDMAALLGELADRGFIQRYQVSSQARGVIQITNFAKHQHPHPKEAASTLPPPPAADTADPLTRMRLFPVGSGIWDPEYTHTARERAGPSGCGNPAHAWCGPRFCVPRFLDDEWRRLRPGDDLAAWYAALDAELASSQEAIAPDALAWLRTRYRARQLAVVQPRTATRRMRQDPADRGAWTCEHEPRCRSTTSCITRTLGDGRAATAARGS